MKRLFYFIICLLVIGLGIKALPGSGNPEATRQQKVEVTNQPAPVELTREFGNDLQATHAVLMELDSGRILFAKAEKETCFPASTTKILTALVALENGELKDKILIGEEANFPSPGSSLAGIRYGEKLTLNELLYGLLLPSGNDVAYTLAVNTARQVSRNKTMDEREAVEYFSGLMNRQAEKAGAHNSHFVNPDGYHDTQHYTTALDMALIAREAMKSEAFRRVVREEAYKLPDISVKGKDGKIQKQERVVRNTNRLISREDPLFFQYATGIKTGHTSQAGYCLVSAAERNGRQVLAVVMNSSEQGVWEDTKSLLEWGLDA